MNTPFTTDYAGIFLFPSFWPQVLDISDYVAYVDDANNMMLILCQAVS